MAFFDKFFDEFLSNPVMSLIRFNLQVSRYQDFSFGFTQIPFLDLVKRQNLDESFITIHQSLFVSLFPNNNFLPVQYFPPQIRLSTSCHPQTISSIVKTYGTRGHHSWQLFMCHQMAMEHESKQKEQAVSASAPQTPTCENVSCMRPLHCDDDKTLFSLVRNR